MAFQDQRPEDASENLDVRPDDDKEDSTSEGGAGEEADSDDDEAYQDNFRDMQESLRKLGPDPRQSDQEQFIDDSGTWLRPRSKDMIDQGNFLHKLAQDGPDAPWLVKHLVNSHPKLLEQTNGDGRSSLLLAIIRRQTEFVKAVLDSNLDEARLRQTLEKAGYNSETCIHQAISRNLDPAITIRLIEKASWNTLASQDQKKLTPLHLAVDYARCTKSGFDVVKALIKYGDGAFDQETGKPDSLSVYRYHHDTRRKSAKTQEEAKSMTSQNSGQSGNGGTKPGTKRPPVPKPMDPGPRGSTANGHKQPKLDVDGENFMSPQLKRANTGARLANPMSSARPTVVPPTAGPFMGNQKMPFLGADDRRSPSTTPGSRELPSNFGLASDGPTPKAKRSSRESKSKASKSSSREKPSEQVAESIAKELKLHYLRSIFRRRPGNPLLSSEPRLSSGIRTRDSAIRFLYGDNKDDNHIYFVFPPMASSNPEKIEFDEFRSSYDRLVFDQVLLSVEFRHVELAQEPLNPRRQNKRNETGTGRKDMEIFFKWLHEKGVTNIIKVTVEDRRGSTPHSDQVIETALKDFDVDILDWRKIDIDPRTVWAATRGDRSILGELHLWWSGNNALLRAWSEEDGLPKLKNLRRIVIHQTQRGLESPDRLIKDIEEFKTRFQARRDALSFAPVQVDHEKPDDESKPRPKGFAFNQKVEGRTGIDSYRWLSVMDTFAQGIQILKPPSTFPDEYLADPALPPELSRDIRIALIDDGADFMHRAIKQILENGRSFDSVYDELEGPGVPSPFHGSTTGHGTLMTYMIGRVCPKVKIFVCKLDVIPGHGGTNSKASFTAKSAADAVEFAVKRGFDIISMSWTIQKSSDQDNDNTADIARLEKAIKSAVDQKKLVFCSAPDIGTASREMLESYYPFSCPGVSDSIFKIGAAKADGSIYGWSGELRNVDFILPGHKVDFKEGDKVDEKDDTPRTGSSVATALAAGLAALIIHCVRLGAIYNFHNGKGNDASVVNKSSVVAIKQFAAMREAFLKISSFGGDKDKDRRIEVESFFDGPGKVLNAVYEKDDARRKWEQITEISRDLISSKAVAKAVPVARY